MNFYFEYYTSPVTTFSIDQPLMVKAGDLIVQGSSNSSIGLLDGKATLSDYVNFLSGLKNVQNLTLKIRLDLQGDAVLFFNGVISDFYYGSTKVQYQFYFFEPNYMLISGEKDYDCYNTDFENAYGDLVYYLQNIQSYVVLPPCTNVEDIKELISNISGLGYSYTFKTQYTQDNTHFVSLQDSVTCRGKNYTTSLKFSVSYTLSGNFTCDSQTIETPLCKLVMACDKDNSENCTKYFELYKEHCQQNLSSDFCFDFVQNYYNNVGAQSQIDSLLSQYCSTKDASQMFVNSQNPQRDFLLCGCHMGQRFYDNFYSSIKDYTEKKGFIIDESLFGQKQVCLFPPCTIASNTFPNQAVGKCDNNVCFNIIEYENDGTVRDQGNITIVEDSKCFVNKRIPEKALSERGAGRGGGILLSDVLILVLVTVILSALVFVLRLRKKANKKK